MVGRKQQPTGGSVLEICNEVGRRKRDKMDHQTKAWFRIGFERSLPVLLMLGGFWLITSADLTDLAQTDRILLLFAFGCYFASGYLLHRSKQWWG